MLMQDTRVRHLDLVIESGVFTKAAENLKSAWDLPEDLDAGLIAALLSQHLALWLEDFRDHPDFFVKDNSRLKREVKALAEESELETELSTLAA